MSDFVRINDRQIAVDGHVYTLGDHSQGDFVAYLKTVNWRTSVSGIVTAVSAFIAFSPGSFSQWPLLLEINKFILAGGIASLGLASKDSNRGSNIPTDELPPHMQGKVPPTVPADGPNAPNAVLGVTKDGPA